MNIASIIAFYFALLFFKRDLPRKDVINGHYERPAHGHRP